MDDLNEIFKKIRNEMQGYEPPLIAKMNDETHFDLWSQRDLVIEGRKRQEIYFAGLIVQKNHVGFYFMPIYTDVVLKTVFEPELLRLLKGKSCFHVKKIDAVLLGQIRNALRTGFILYQERGWV